MRVERKKKAPAPKSIPSMTDIINIHMNFWRHFYHLRKPGSAYLATMMRQLLGEAEEMHWDIRILYQYSNKVMIALCWMSVSAPLILMCCREIIKTEDKSKFFNLTSNQHLEHNWALQQKLNPKYTSKQVLHWIK